MLKIHNKINKKTYEETINEKIIEHLECSYKASLRHIREKEKGRVKRPNANILVTGFPKKVTKSIVENWCKQKGLVLVSIKATDSTIENDLDSLLIINNMEKYNLDLKKTKLAPLVNKVYPDNDKKCVLFIDELNKQESAGIRYYLKSIYETPNENKMFDVSKNLLFTVACVNYSVPLLFNNSGIGDLTMEEQLRFVDSIGIDKDINYYKMLTTDEIKKEYLYLKSYMSSAFNLYNSLILRIQEFIDDVKDKMIYLPSELSLKFLKSCIENIIAYFDKVGNLLHYVIVEEIKIECNDWNREKYLEEINGILKNKMSDCHSVNEMNYVKVYFKDKKYSSIDSLKYLYLNLLPKLDEYIDFLYRNHEKNLIKFSEEMLTEITNITEEVSDCYINLEQEFEKFISKENLEILSKYNCFYKIINFYTKGPIFLDNDDFEFYFTKGIITKIIYEEEEIVLSSLKPNVIFALDTIDEFYDDSMTEVMKAINKYRNELIDINGPNEMVEYFFSPYSKKLVIYLQVNY